MPQLRSQTRRHTRSRTRMQALPYRTPQSRSVDNESPVIPPLLVQTQRPEPIPPLTPTLPIPPVSLAFEETVPQIPGSTVIPVRPTTADILTIDFRHPAARCIPIPHLKGLAGVLGREMANLQQQRDLAEETLMKHYAIREKAKEHIVGLEAVINEIGSSPSLVHQLAKAKEEVSVQQGKLEPLLWSLMHIDD
ncbi:hypothetical protein NW767_014881 [Fusarium falciforme]|nr:hypothetical protein NW767_014881 [Fusarium falciforme]